MTRRQMVGSLQLSLLPVRVGLGVHSGNMDG